MGKSKKESNRKSGEEFKNVKTKGENFYHDAKKVKVLKLRESKAQRNRDGKIVKAAPYQSKDRPTSARVEPNRKWFTNSRVIAQDSLNSFREAVEKQASDPFSVLLKSNKLPLSLIRDSKFKNGPETHKVVTEHQPLADTFGPNSRRKRVKLDVGSLEDLAGRSGDMQSKFDEKHDEAANTRTEGGEVDAANDQPMQDEWAGPRDNGELSLARESIFTKGTSRRIFNELYKTLDASDVVCQVLDARDPIGTRCYHVEKFLREEAPHKHVMLLLNKCDLVPTNVAATWVRHLSKEKPTLAFHASLTNSFGKGSLISVLRQFSQLHKNRKQISVSFIGYPNVGKSSIINVLRAKKVAKTAPVPGETRVWQYIKLMKRILLIDCPGIVPPSQSDSDEDILLRGAIRVEAVENPAQYVAAALRKCKQRHVEKTYDIKGYTDADDFLEQLARKSGKMLKGGEADTNTVARSFLNQFMRGKLPWFIPPPQTESATAAPAADGVIDSLVDAEAPGLEGVLRAEDEAESPIEDDDDESDENDDDEMSNAEDEE